MKRTMTTFTVIGAGILLLGCAADAQSGEPADSNLAVAIQHQAAQAQESIRRAALADLHANARRQFADLSVSTPLVLASAQPGATPRQPL